eukprot:1692663-Rhodomonas_salina.2
MAAVDMKYQHNAAPISPYRMCLEVEKGRARGSGERSPTGSLHVIATLSVSTTSFSARYSEVYGSLTKFSARYRQVQLIFARCREATYHAALSFYARYCYALSQFPSHHTLFSDRMRAWGIGVVGEVTKPVAAYRSTIRHRTGAADHRGIEEGVQREGRRRSEEGGRDEVFREGALDGLDGV